MARRTALRLWSALFASAVVLLSAGPAAAAPAGPSTAPARPTSVPRPTVDPSAASPTAPLPGGPPAGSAPDGSTVGGPGLRTRGLVVTTGAPPLPDGIGAAGWLVADLDTGTVLAARDPHGRYYPASTLKTLTLLTLAHAVSWDQVVPGTPEDEQMEGTRVGLVAGGAYPVRLLFEALIMESGNDAANALARAAGGVPQTLAAMNATAGRLGADDTVAGTPSGLDVAGQSSSPYDLALIFRALMDDPLTAGVFRVRTADIPPVPARNMPGFQIQNQNPLLEDYPGDLGAKDGFTDAARHTFVTAAQRNGRRLVVTLMQDERKPVDTPVQAARLLDWGFSLPSGTAGVGRLVRPGEVPTTAPASAPASGGEAAARAGALGGGSEPSLPLAVLGGAGGLALAGGGWLAYRRSRRGSAAGAAAKARAGIR